MTIDTVNASQGADAIGGMSQINTSLQPLHTTLNVLFDSPGKAEVKISQPAVPRAFGLSTDDREVDTSQQDAASSCSCVRCFWARQ
ncbi:unnamed protein product [Phytophthora fragariaefolia]|uniref:Unnamed protein product n=1 Tax=Phytophthora fragariaefolia TaxID=1490495 RepID=A0A9W6WRX1_9STRA|nr:unnamed protein product [Phytophthora fragariaefolia]